MDHVLQIDVATLAFISGTAIPLVVALITKAHASSRVKALANLILSVIGGGIAAWTQAKGSISLGQIFTAMVTTYLTSGVSYNNLWKPVGVSGAVANGTQNLGIGGPAPAEVDEVPAPDDVAFTEEDRITTLKSHPIYRDSKGYLFTPVDSNEA